MYIINFDDCVIFKVTEESRYYDKHYPTFNAAKLDLVDYWDKASKQAKLTLREAIKIKETDVKSFINEP